MKTNIKPRLPLQGIILFEERGEWGGGMEWKKHHETACKELWFHLEEISDEDVSLCQFFSAWDRLSAAAVWGPTPWFTLSSCEQSVRGAKAHNPDM